VHLKLPALRDRKEDIMSLAEYFLEEYSKKYHKSIGGMSPEVESVFTEYSWPGNIRELKYCIERSVVVCDQPFLTINDLPDTICIDSENCSQGIEIENGLESGALDTYRNEYMRKIILQTLEQTNGNKQEAAKLLNISRQTLYNRMKELDIQNEYR
jgi:DNA-binding NtrC family response regulator